MLDKYVKRLYNSRWLGVLYPFCEHSNVLDNLTKGGQMKLNRKSESGRSMTEMIAVLVIIGILTVCTLGGYSFVVKKSD